MPRCTAVGRCWPAARRWKLTPLVDCADREVHMRDRAAGTSAETGGERFYDLALLYRGRTGLTQRDLAARLGVHVRSVQAWEGGISYPDAAHLQALLAAYLAAGGLDARQELAQAQTLWAAALRDAPRLRTPFDQRWFAGLLAERTTPGEPARSRVAEKAADGDARRQDWGEA